MKNAILVAVAIGMVAHVAPAWAIDGNNLYEICREGSANTNCLMYVTGALDEMVDRRASTMAVLETLQERGVNVPAGIQSYLIEKGCKPSFPPNNTNGQNTDIVAKYLREHPEFRSKGGAELAEIAIIEAFPCGSQ